MWYSMKVQGTRVLFDRHPDILRYVFGAISEMWPDGYIISSVGPVPLQLRLREEADVTFFQSLGGNQIRMVWNKRTGYLELGEENHRLLPYLEQRGLLAEEEYLKVCTECGGSLVMRGGKGRRWVLSQKADPITLPDDLELPTCVECETDFVPPEIEKRLQERFKQV